MMDEKTLREAIVAEAKSWLGTPYHDHCGIKGVGVDCAYFPFRVWQAVGIIPPEYEPPPYLPQQWMKKEEDPTYMNELVKFATEIDVSQVAPGDLVIFKLANSWTHGSFIIDWPHYILHPLASMGVVGSHIDEGFLWRREKRYFTVVTNNGIPVRS